MSTALIIALWLSFVLIAAMIGYLQGVHDERRWWMRTCDEHLGTTFAKRLR